MKKNDWYRRTTWSADDAKQFELRLSRARSQKPQYLKIQAWTLAETDDPAVADAAIELANRCLQEDPDGFFTVQAHLIIAKALATKREISGAISAYRKAVDAEARLRGPRCCAYLEFAWFVATNDRTEVFEEALKAMESMEDRDLIFPISQYRYFGALALISDFFGDHAHASRMATNALRAVQQSTGPFARHEDLGIVKGIDEHIQRRIWELAA